MNSARRRRKKRPADGKEESSWRVEKGVKRERSRREQGGHLYSLSARSWWPARQRRRPQFAVYWPDRARQDRTDRQREGSQSQSQGQRTEEQRTDRQDKRTRFPKIISVTIRWKMLIRNEVIIWSKNNDKKYGLTEVSADPHNSKGFSRVKSSLFLVLGTPIHHHYRFPPSLFIPSHPSLLRTNSTFQSPPNLCG